MKGIVFNLLDEVVRLQHGEDAWDDVLDAAHVDGVFTSVGNYNDQVLGQLVKAASQRFGTSIDATVRWFGQQSVPLLATRYPAFFEGHTSTRSFLLTLNDIIHPEVRKIYPGATPPHFDFDTSLDDALGIGYRSPRRLCSFAEGLIEGASRHFHETVTISHQNCMKQGAHGCIFQVTFRR